MQQLAKRTTAPGPGRKSAFDVDHLPPDVLAESAQRLGTLALLTTGVTVVILGIFPGLWQRQGATLGIGLKAGLGALTAAVGLLVFVACRWQLLPPARLLALGRLYQIVQALLSAIQFHSHPHPDFDGVTPVGVWTLVFPLIVPGSPGRTLLFSVLSATMDPLGLALNVALGAPVPPSSVLARMFVFTAIASVLAPLAARIVSGLAAEVGKAREMGSYRLVELLGRGGMGEVWRAEHRMLARMSALKIIHPDVLGTNPAHAREMLQRFDREARATAALRSPHTVGVYDFGTTRDGAFYYVMELLEGYSLEALVNRFGPVPPARAVHLLRQICRSLDEAHGVGLIHRDIKPANVFVCALGTYRDFVKVLDFGLVKAHRPAPGAVELTSTGEILGTPAYMPPEMALGDLPVDGRSDLYSLGCVAYWLLSGNPVFKGTTAIQIMLSHVHTPPPPLATTGDQAIPSELEAVVLRCLEKDPDKRPPSARALDEALGSLALANEWTEARAREWWEAHPPSAPPSSDRDPTLSGILEPLETSVSGERPASPSSA
jgi:serine/threonine-protein kinase